MQTPLSCHAECPEAGTVRNNPARHAAVATKENWIQPVTVPIVSSMKGNHPSHTSRYLTLPTSDLVVRVTTWGIVLAGSVVAALLGASRLMQVAIF